MGVKVASNMLDILGLFVDLRGTELSDHTFSLEDGVGSSSDVVNDCLQIPGISFISSVPEPVAFKIDSRKSCRRIFLRNLDSNPFRVSRNNLTVVSGNRTSIL